MANLFISYDLYQPGQNYETVIATIKKFGSWAKVQQSLWYINTNQSCEQVAKTIWRVMDNSDSLIIIDATNNDAYWYNVNEKVAGHLQKSWLLRGT